MGGYVVSSRELHAISRGWGKGVTRGARSDRAYFQVKSRLYPRSGKSRERDLNPQPPLYESGALPLSYPGAPTRAG